MLLGTGTTLQYRYASNAAYFGWDNCFDGTSTVPIFILWIFINNWVFILIYSEIYSKTSVPDPDSDPSIIKQKVRKTLILLFCDFFWTFFFGKWCKCTFKKYCSNKQKNFFFKLVFSWRLEGRVSEPDPDPHGSALIWVAGSGSAFKLLIRIQEGKNDPQKLRKYRIFRFWSAGCLFFKAKGFSCSLGVLYGGLGIGKWKFLIKNIKIKFPAVNFFQF